jgi:hypothetical protein
MQVGGIGLHVGPTVLGGPDDLDEVIRTFIGGARKQLLVAVQELDRTRGQLTSRSAGSHTSSPAAFWGAIHQRRASGFAAP